MVVWWSKYKLLRQLRHDLEAVISPLAHQLGGIPREFWQDNYILGYLYASSLLLLQLYNKESSNHPSIFSEILENFSGFSSVYFTEKVRKSLKEEDSDFAQGIENARKVFCLIMNLKFEASEEDTKQGRGYLRSQTHLKISNGLTENSSPLINSVLPLLGRILFDQLFVNYAKNLNSEKVSETVAAMAKFSKRHSTAPAPLSIIKTSTGHRLP